MAEEYDPAKVMQGRILAVRIMVKKQVKAIKEVETELLQAAEADLDDPDRVKAASKSLRDFHVVVENALAIIAKEFDDGIPRVENVHQALLAQMAGEYKQSRPAVIDAKLAEELGDYLRFRLDFEADPETAAEQERVKALLAKAEATSTAVRTQLMDFFDKLSEYHGISEGGKEK